MVFISYAYCMSSTDSVDNNTIYMPYKKINDLFDYKSTIEIHLQLVHEVPFFRAQIAAALSQGQNISRSLDEHYTKLKASYTTLDAYYGIKSDLLINECFEYWKVHLNYELDLVHMNAILNLRNYIIAHDTNDAVSYNAQAIRNILSSRLLDCYSYFQHKNQLDLQSFTDEQLQQMASNTIAWQEDNKDQWNAYVIGKLPRIFPQE